MDKPCLGAHMSVAGGLYKALLRGREAGCEAVQIFSKNANQWKAKPLTAEDIALWEQTRQDTGYDPSVLVVHDSYLINLATPDPDLRDKSLAAFGDPEAVTVGALTDEISERAGDIGFKGGVEAVFLSVDGAV